MGFQKNSAFYQAEQLLLGVKDTDPTFSVEASRDMNPVQGVTGVQTSDIERLEYDIRDLEFTAHTVEASQIFRGLADRVASFYKG